MPHCAVCTVDTTGQAGVLPCCYDCYVERPHDVERMAAVKETLPARGCRCCVDTHTPRLHTCYSGHACSKSVCAWCSHPLRDHAKEARHV